MKLSLVIPTYNEKENIQKLLAKLKTEFKDNRINGEIIAVDDNSPDGTGKILEDLKKKYNNLKVIHRKGKLGLSSAVLEGWKIAKGQILGVMDADLSHPPEKIKEMYRVIEKGEADFVIGSRYVKGGEIEGWGIFRKLMSRGATLFARIFTNVKDPMSGFFMIKRECLKNKKLNSKGFKILLELIIKADYSKIKEIPIVFINRKKGKSKAGTSEIFYYLKNLWGYLPYRKNVISEFFKFCLVGLTGTVVNLAVLYSLTEYLGMHYLLSAVFAFVIAATSNFFLNKTWTFREKAGEKVLKKYSQFFIVSLTALAVNLCFLWLFTDVFKIYYIISQMIAIAVSMIINFIGNKTWTFR